jgi:hypothetical protein
MPAAAPRLSSRLLDAIVRLDDRSVSIAEVCRRVGDEADRLGLTRPSYQRIRVLVHELRRVQRRGPSTAGILFEVAALRTKPPQALADHLAGIGPPPYDERDGVK